MRLYSSLRSATSDSRRIYVVFAEVHGGVSHDFVAAYSTPALAQQFINTQHEQLRECLVVWAIEIDREPSDPYWATPQSMAAAMVRKSVAQTRVESESEATARARARGRQIMDTWCTDGTLVDAGEVERRRGAPVAELESDSLVVVKREGQRHYLACVFELPPLDVVRVNRGLTGCESSDRVLFWLNKHGALQGMTPAQAVQAGRLERVAQIAAAWVAERTPPGG